VAGVFGAIPGVPVGSAFASRREAANAGVHRPLQAGISGGAQSGAESIVVPGGYEDDEDRGETIIYSGHGGNDPQTGRQIADQTLTRQNLALAVSSDRGLPVRVLRGASGRSAALACQRLQVRRALLRRALLEAEGPLGL
jgi:putative restriction endonuclease